MPDSIPPELRPPLEPHAERATQLDPITHTVQTIGSANNQTRDAIKQARTQGVISSSQAENLQQERSGCLTIALRAASKVIPTRFKPRLYSALQKGDLDRAYIASLNPQEQAAELSRLVRLYKEQVSDSFYDTENPQGVFIRAEKAMDGLITVLDKKGFDAETESMINDVSRGLSFWNKAGVNVTIADRARLARKLVDYGVRKATPTVGIAILRDYAGRFDDNDPSSLITRLPVENRPDAVSGILEELRYETDGGIFSRGDYIFKLMDGLEPGQTQPMLTTLIKRVSSIPKEDGAKRVATAKRILSCAIEDSRIRIIDNAEGEWREIVTAGEGKAQLDQIVDITDKPAEQDSIFWRVASHNHDYREHPKFDVNATVARAEPDRNKTYFVANQLRTGLLSQEATTTYGGRIIAQMMTSENINTRSVAATAQMYGVDLSPYRVRLIEEVESAFRNGTLTRDGTNLARQLGSVEFATGWESFRYDVQATPELGEKTWRREQSIIDTLQNHLDANDFKYAYQLVEAALGKSEAEFLLAEGNIATTANQLYKFKERYPIPDNERSHYLVYRSQESMEELAKRISGIEKVKPAIQVLIHDKDNGDIWIDRERISDYPHEIELHGVRFIDTGFGYDEQLNAKFIPTKDEFVFLRGRFGQGAKMSMIALQREGCQVKVNSAFLDPETGERIEWEGTPAISERTRTVEFAGKKRRSFSSSYLNTTGSATEILFDSANETTRRLFQDMFDTRVNPEGIGQYILDYQTSNAFKYGAFGNEIQISIAPSQAGKVYVQGLEIPAQNAHGLGCGYNLPSADFLTGRDRTFLELKKLKDEVAEAWAGVTDREMLSSFYTIALGDSRSAASIERSAVDGFSWRLSEEAKVIHRQLLQHVLGLDDSHQKVVLVSKLDLEDQNAIEKFRAAGFSVFTGQHDANIKYFVDDLFGKPTFYQLDDAKREIEGHLDRSYEAPEKLKTQLNDILEKARDDVISILAEFGFTDEISNLGRQEISILVRGQNDRDPDKKWVDRSSIYNQEKEKYVGYHIVVYPENITGTGQPPEILSETDIAHLKFLMEMELLSLCASGQKGTTMGTTKFIFGQDIANRLIEKGVDPSSPEFAKAQAVTIRPTEIDLSKHTSGKIIKHDETIVSLDQTVISLDSYNLSLVGIKDNLDRINGLLSQPEIDHNRSGQIEQMTCRQYFEEGKIYETVARKEQDLLQRVDLVEVPSRLLGSKNGVDVFLVGEGENARIAAAVNLENVNAVVLRDNRGEVVLSKYKSQQNKGHWGRDVVPIDATSLLRDFWKGSFVQESVIGKNVISFPIGARSQKDVEARAEYFMNSYPLQIETGGHVSTVEENIGLSHIEATHSVDYGKGKVWDDPRRIFGDVVQNHLDEAGKQMTMTYQVTRDGQKEWVDQATLMKSEYGLAHIVGVSFGDAGKGYSTKQLLVFGESDKSRGGKRGKFGEGLKMLSASCIRNGFDLTLKSRQWEAKASSRPNPIITHGRRTTVDMVGFDMKWNDGAREGSVTQVSIPDDISVDARKLWQQWADVIDPRKKNEIGYSGLERYVRALRTNERTAQIGPVTVLLDEPNVFYEGGIIIPDADQRMEKKYLFGYDIDGDIIATQERNVVDTDKLQVFLTETFSHLPVEMCERILQEVRYQTSPAEQIENLMQAPQTSGARRDPETLYEEFRLVDNIEDIEALRLAYYRTFGEKALLSSAASAKQMLYEGFNKNGKPLSEEEQALLRGVIANEQHHFPPDMLVHMDSPKYYYITKKLEGQVDTIKGLVESIMQQPRAISEAEAEQLKQLVQSSARAMTDTFQYIYDSPGGRDILTKLLHSSDRKLRTTKEKPTETTIQLSARDQDVTTPDEDVENMLFYLEAVAEEVLPMELQVKNSAMAAEAYAFGSNGIAFSDRIFTDPAHAAAATQHELIHLATQTVDYNTTFMGLLMLMNPKISGRF